MIPGIFVVAAILVRSRVPIAIYMALVAMIALKGWPVFLGGKTDLLDILLMFVASSPWSMFAIEHMPGFTNGDDEATYLSLWSFVLLNLILRGSVELLRARMGRRDRGGEAGSTGPAGRAGR